MSKSIKILFLFLIISLFYKSTVFACGPYFPEYSYDPDQILSEYFPLVSNIGTTNYKDNPILNSKFEVIGPLWGTEYMLPVYLASKNKELPDNIKNALVRYLDDRDYYLQLKRESLGDDNKSVDNPVLEGEKNELTLWQKVGLFIQGISFKNKSESEMESEYKLAAEEYYKGNYNKSIALFNKIYKNRNHSFRDKAALSLGWSYIAKANQQYEIDLKNKSKTADKDRINDLKTAQIYYEKIIKDNSLSEIKTEANKYLDYVLFRTDPITRMTRAGKVLLTTTDPEEFLRNLHDFIPLWHNNFYKYISAGEEVPNLTENINRIKKSDDEFTQFLLAWTAINSNSLTENIDKYKTTNSPLWLIMAQRQIKTNDKEWNLINDEINKIGFNSPFYITAKYYNLTAQSSDLNLKDKTKNQILDLISLAKKNKQYSSENLFNGLMFNISDGFMEKQKYSMMNDLGYVDTYWGERLLPPYYSYVGFEPNDDLFITSEMKNYLNSLDIDELNKQISNENIFNPKLKQYLRLLVFTKATLQDRLDISKNIATLLIKNNSIIGKDLSKFISSNNIDEQRFLAYKFIIDYPGIAGLDSKYFDEFSNGPLSAAKTFDMWRRNWSFNEVCYQFVTQSTPEEKPTNSDDLIVNKTAKNIIDFAVKNPSYSLVPEVLHNLVDMTHYSECKDKQSAEYSKRAFQFLHNNYSGNIWTIKTPYWFEY